MVANQRPSQTTMITTSVTTAPVDNEATFGQPEEHKPAEASQEQANDPFADIVVNPIQARWKTKLANKSEQTQKAYSRHIKEFENAMNGATYLNQDDVDRYFSQLKKEDDKRPDGKQESASTKVHRISALKIYLKNCLKLSIDFSDYSIKSST